MAQHDYAIANQSGAAFRADLNNALAAIVSQNSGATEPSTTYAYMPWADITAGVMKIRNGANNGWITLYQLDGEWTSIALENGTAAAPSLYFKGSGTGTGLFSAGTDQLNIATGGTERVKWGTSEVAFNDSGANCDFRIEGDTKPNLFLLDASADSVSIDGAFAVTGNANLASLNGGQLAGMRNVLINGDMRISQRGTTFPNATDYTVDRFLVRRLGAATGVTAQQVYGAFGSNKHWLKVTRNAGDTSTADTNVYQMLEGINSRHLAGQRITLSALVGTGGNLSVTTGNVNLVCYYQTGATDIGVNGAWTSAGGGVFSIPSASSPQRLQAQVDIPANATQILAVVITTHAGTAGADESYYITDAQLEAGTVATPFERRSYAQELMLCQRYYETSYPAGTAVGAASDATGAVLNVAVNGTDFYSYGCLRFAVAKRVAPSVTVYNPITGVSGGFRGINDGSNNIATTAMQYIGNTGIGRVYANSNNMTANSVYAYHYAASAEL